jgi:hypothetical protein
MQLLPLMEPFLNDFFHIFCDSSLSEAMKSFFSILGDQNILRVGYLALMPMSCNVPAAKPRLGQFLLSEAQSEFKN